MQKLPTAKSPQPSVVQLSPFGPSALGSEDKTERLWKQSPNCEVFTSFKCFLPDGERLRRGPIGRRLKKHQEQRENAERGSEPHAFKTKRQVCEWPKSREPRQLSLLAKKVHQECSSQNDDREPVSTLVDCVAPEVGTTAFSIGDQVEVRDRDMTEWRVGTVTGIHPLKVTLPEWDQAFEWDLIRSKEDSSRQTPTHKRTKSSHKWSPSNPWKAGPINEHERESASVPVASPASQCSCGNPFQLDALFCSRCGRQRGCEVINTTTLPASKPLHPSLPVQPSWTTPQPAMQRTASDFVSWLRRHREAERTLPLPDFSSEGGHANQSCLQRKCPGLEAANSIRGGRDIWKSLSSPQLTPRPLSPSSHKTIASRLVDRNFLCTEGTTSLLSVRRMNRQHQQWQQLTVPILAENGEVINLCPMAQDGQGVWQQNTIPILGENGEVIALRPAVGNGPLREWRPDTLPIFNSRGSIIALPSGGQCEWPSESVPILADKGEVIGLRPSVEHEKAWRQKEVPIFGTSGKVMAICPSIGNLKRWNKITVPLVADNGEVIFLHPPAECPDVPAQSALGEVLLATAKPSTRLSMCNTGTSSAWNKTNVPPSLITRIRKRSCSESAIGLHVPESDSRLPSPCSSRSLKSRQDGPKGHAQPGPSVFFTELDDDCSMNDAAPEVVASPAVAVEDDAVQISCSNLPQSSPVHPSLRPLAIPRAPVAPTCPASPGTQRTSASIDSLASIREVIRIANDAKQSTPDGHMLQVLQEALVLNRSGNAGCCVSSLLQRDAPETREVAERLSQLPDLWRTTILKLLEEAESLQLPPNPGVFR